jgi:hypothetical protein
MVQPAATFSPFKVSFLEHQLIIYRHPLNYHPLLHFHIQVNLQLVVYESSLGLQMMCLETYCFLV